ncbi:uncharacterized protein EI97DRAFT_436679 [Westerdykella ornata]|uniref:MINDY deubiquitinase domain-containing protein n=1 Tax=Westerdykella ornata TaxID=318751 RepID=A0A6A6J8Z8_WESOR|nr:uncharacterized protein EI97DRAFT_436679 [Westerdykella ornata]KAF2272747.1 hypothetical protein EI97DRAFT_436679 [Westerdykella ornata]
MGLRQQSSQGNLVPAPLSPAVNNPPYPVTPSTEEPPVLPPEFAPDPNRSPAFTIRTPDPPQTTTKEDKDGSEFSESDWEKSDDEDAAPNHDIPDPLKIGGGKPIPSPRQKNTDSLPDALKVGPPAGVTSKMSWEKLVPEPTGSTEASWGGVSTTSSGGSIPLQTNNPYLRMQQTGQSNYGAESSQQVWGDVSGQAQKHEEVAELPTTQTPVTPTDHMAKLAFHSDVDQPPRPNSPDQPPLIAVESPTPLQTPASANAHQQATSSQAREPDTHVSSVDAWARKHGLPTDNEFGDTSELTRPEQQNWTQGEQGKEQQTAIVGNGTPSRVDQGPQQVGGAEFPGQADSLPPTSLPSADEEPPALPPRRSHEQEQPPAMPPRPIDTTAGGSLLPDIESPNTVMNKRRKEHYPIKHIRWLDANTRQIRESPILTQNINGPCPLLALVNALVLSTPAGLKTEFVETLRTREQVSLGLLVDAVIEELLSGRRGTELGDVNELYKFLIGLQTGMNVNPMFVQEPAENHDSTTLTHPTARPGGFESTRDMRLYRTFNIPLIHGWLPEPGSEAYIAFERVAKSYETAQLVQFQEEELERKLQEGGLNPDEQRLFTDIHAIKEFFSRWPTQLSDYGLQNMQQAIKPGEVGILFRNDHFSTLYKNPHTDELMTLVTDQGYSSHEEIVWESLVDVSGRGNELYSGDFRAVGNNNLPQRQQQQQPVQSLLDIGDDQGWATVSNNRRRNQSSSAPGLVSVQDSSNPTTETNRSRSEQEDHDLALALQLQEEEEARHEEERRRRENALSEDAISGQGQGRGGSGRTPRQSEYPPLIPPRRSNLSTQRPNNEAAPPPTYEEAATSPQYHPPQGVAPNPSRPLRPRSTSYQASSAGGRPMGHMPHGMPPRGGRRQSGVVGPDGRQEKEKCTVM